LKKKSRCKKILRVLLIWTVISLLIQGGAYSLLNRQVMKLLTPINNGPITLSLQAEIPAVDLENIQISYAKDYLAYMEKGTLKVFNLISGEVVFEKKSPAANDGALGIIAYQWLPDRNTLLYFYARKNPNAVTVAAAVAPTAVAAVPPAAAPVTPPSPAPAVVDPAADKDRDPEDPTATPTPDDPKIPEAAPPAAPPKPVNPQITELYSLELPNSNETDAPEDTFKETIINFPAGGKIANMVFSTPTNLIYITVTSGTAKTLLEINVMGSEAILNRAGEAIDNMAASDRNPTLYIDSQTGTGSQVVAVDVTKRYVVSKNDNDKILGVREGRVYIGEVDKDQLIRIKTAADLVELTDQPSLTTEWEGSLPFDEDTRVLIGVKGQVVVYDYQTASIIMNGELAAVELQGDENYISLDGAELIQLTKKANATLVKLQPLALQPPK
jgi:hypothetical protein